MPKSFILKTIASVLGLSITIAAFPVFASDNDSRKNGDCLEQGSQLRQGNGKGMGQGVRRKMSQGLGGGHMMQRFSIIDINDDGRISDDEAAAQREFVFAAMDSDDDQELTIEEFLGVFMGQGEGRDNKRVEKRQQSKKIRFAPMDTDKSGTVSISEWMTEGQQRFAAADTDNDGIVTPWEFRSRARH